MNRFYASVLIMACTLLGLVIGYHFGLEDSVVVQAQATIDCSEEIAIKNNLLDRLLRCQQSLDNSRACCMDTLSK